MQKIPVRFKRIDENRSFVLPAKATPGAAAYDIHASLDGISRLKICGGETFVIPTNLRVEIPDGWEIVITPRSGLAIKESVTVLNSPGTIDSDYRGEIGVVIHAARSKYKSSYVIINDGDRIAQLKIKPSYEIEWVESQNLSMTIRGDHGFGSTGV